MADVTTTEHAAPAADAHGHDEHAHGEHDHHELGFWQTYVFSVDHKVIGIQYALTGTALPCCSASR